MPESFLAKARAPQATVTVSDPFDAARGNGHRPGVSYGRAALDGEIERMLAAGEGTRNHTLNRCAFAMGQLVAGGEIDEYTVTTELCAAARLVGLDEREIAATYRSGLLDGMLLPRKRPESNWNRPTPAGGWAKLNLEVGAPPPTQEPAAAPLSDTPIYDLTMRYTEHERARRAARRIVDAEDADARLDWPDRAIDGASFAYDLPADTPAVWGAGAEVLWAEGESLIICGPQGVGKTTVAGQLVMARLGLLNHVLGVPVIAGVERVLYLAMDRPQQAARSLGRMLSPDWRDTLHRRLVVWQGPPPHDLAAHPEVLAEMCRRWSADTVVIDSVKDAAVGIAKDEVGAGYNRARQMAIAAGVQVLELHHQVKSGQGGGKPTSINDVYGSVWITSGAGSVVLLWGEPGDGLVELRHLKQPVEPVGPWDVRHDHNRGLSMVVAGTDLWDLARWQSNGLSPRAAACAMFSVGEPSRAQIESARRRLDRFVREGRMSVVDGSRGGSPSTYFAVLGGRDE